MTSRLQWLNIGPRLTLCFILIILAMLLGNAVLLWQFQRARNQVERLSGVDQELIAVLLAHTNLMSFYDRLDVLANSENTAELVKEAEPLHNALLEDSRRSRNVLGRLPPEVELDPTLLPTLEAIQDALPAELDAITVLAKSRDWQAVRLRLVNQVRPLEFRTSVLVESIDREVGEKRAQALLKIAQAQRRILLIVPATAILTLLFAAALGLAITRSITRPLGRLMEGSKALAGGDFSHRVPAVGKDEIARLGSVFNDMIRKLHELYRELQSREAHLAEAQELSHTVVLAGIFQRRDVLVPRDFSDI
jgi:methyl-accepting chemotaxis protein